MNYSDSGDGKEDSGPKTKGIPARENCSARSRGATFASDSLSVYLNDIRKPELLSAEVAVVGQLIDKVWSIDKFPV